MAEFIGNEPLSGEAMSVLMMIGDRHRRNVRKVSDLPSCLEADLEIFRSLWDSVSLLVRPGH